MHGFYYTIELLEPLLANSLAGDANSAQSLCYVPAHSVRGAVIGEYLKNDQTTFNALRDDLRRLFFDGKTRYLDAHPILNDEKRGLPVSLAWHKLKTDDHCDSREPKELIDLSIYQRRHENQLTSLSKDEFCDSRVSETEDEGQKILWVEMVEVGEQLNVHNQRAPHAPLVSAWVERARTRPGRRADRPARKPGAGEVRPDRPDAGDAQAAGAQPFAGTAGHGRRGGERPGASSDSRRAIPPEPGSAPPRRAKRRLPAARPPGPPLPPPLLPTSRSPAGRSPLRAAPPPSRAGRPAARGGPTLPRAAPAGGISSRPAAGEPRPRSSPAPRSSRSLRSSRFLRSLRSRRPARPAPAAAGAAFAARAPGRRPGAAGPPDSARPSTCRGRIRSSSTVRTTHCKRRATALGIVSAVELLQAHEQPLGHGVAVLLRARPLDVHDRRLRRRSGSPTPPCSRWQRSSSSAYMK